MRGRCEIQAQATPADAGAFGRGRVHANRLHLRRCLGLLVRGRALRDRARGARADLRLLADPARGHGRDGQYARTRFGLEPGQYARDARRDRHVHREPARVCVLDERLVPRRDHAGRHQERIRGRPRLARRRHGRSRRAPLGVLEPGRRRPGDTRHDPEQRGSHAPGRRQADRQRDRRGHRTHAPQRDQQVLRALGQRHRGHRHGRGRALHGLARRRGFGDQRRHRLRLDALRGLRERHDAAQEHQPLDHQRGGPLQRRGLPLRDPNRCLRVLHAAGSRGPDRLDLRDIDGGRRPLLQRQLRARRPVFRRGLPAAGRAQQRVRQLLLVADQ